MGKPTKPLYNLAMSMGDLETMKATYESFELVRKGWAHLDSVKGLVSI